MCEIVIAEYFQKDDSFEQPTVLLWLPSIRGWVRSFEPSSPLCFGREMMASCISPCNIVAGLITVTLGELVS